MPMSKETQKIETEVTQLQESVKTDDVTCSCWTYEPKPICEDRNSVRHYWAW